MSDTQKILAELRHDGQLLHLTLNAPKANVLDAEMLAGIEAAVYRYAESPRLKAIVFEGAGKHFSFGASVEEHQADQAAGMLDKFHGLFRGLAQHGVPTFAVVRGQCLGGGLELASYCSRLFAHPGAVFGQPEIRLGVIAPMASVLLPWRCGGGAALDLCVSGRSVDAAEAYRIRLVSEISEDPAAACDAYFTQHLVPLSASSIRFAEVAARVTLMRRLDSDLRTIEKIYLSELMQTHDANEGIAAFLAKRPPAFTGE
jgi:cyclohexa-1,5-dienecarbonyl-CoA hydratase